MVNAKTYCSDLTKVEPVAELPAVRDVGKGRVINRRTKVLLPSQLREHVELSKHSMCAKEDSEDDKRRTFHDDGKGGWLGSKLT
jgi:hypothetical protein